MKSNLTILSSRTGLDVVEVLSWYVALALSKWRSVYRDVTCPAILVSNPVWRQSNEEQQLVRPSGFMSLLRYKADMYFDV